MNSLKVAFVAMAMTVSASVWAQGLDGGLSPPPSQPATPIVDSNAATMPIAPTPTAVEPTAVASPGTGGSTPAPQGVTVAAANPNTLASAVSARTPEEQANQTGLQIITSLDHWLGVGTFVDSKSFSYLTANLTVQPQVLFGVKGVRLAASATLRGSYEYTMPDNDTGRRFAPADIRLGLSAPALFRDKALTGISVTPSMGVLIPTSLESWNAGLITSLSLGAAATRSFTTPIGGFDLRLSLGGSRGFFTNPVNGVRVCRDATCAVQRDAFGNQTVLSRPNELFGASAGMNTAWSLNIASQVNWRASGEVIVYVGYTFIKTWREAATLTLDDMSPKGVDANGNPVARSGYGQVDRTSAFVGASYQLNEHYSLDLGLSTVQLPLTATGQVRFPFFSFGALADNSTTAYFTLTAAY